MRAHWILVVVFAALSGSLSPTASAAQRRGAAEGPRGTPPPDGRGAWWYTGAKPPETPRPPDLTGVWHGATSGDLSRSTLPGQEMVLTPYGLEMYKTVDHSTDPNTFCLPPGPARMIMMAHPAMIVQRPELVTVLTESQRTFRLIYTDGRGHPKDVYDYPEWMGSSIGKWEGDTLVVETVSINDRTWLDTSGHEHSDQLKLNERFRLVDPNTLEHIVTYTDPKFFVKPFTTRRTFTRGIGELEGRILDHSCLENEKDQKNLVPLIGGAGLEPDNGKE
jgi:hypothetical protein